MISTPFFPPPSPIIHTWRSKIWKSLALSSTKKQSSLSPSCQIGRERGGNKLFFLHPTPAAALHNSQLFLLAFDTEEDRAKRENFSGRLAVKTGLQRRTKWKKKFPFPLFETDTASIWHEKKFKKPEKAPLFLRSLDRSGHFEFRVLTYNEWVQLSPPLF